MIEKNFKIEKLWQPVLLSDIERIVDRKIYSENSKCYQYGLRKNICYNLQYLEFVSKHCFDEMELTSVLRKQNYKIFIIIASSIIEGILYHELRQNNLMGGGWRLLKIFKSNPLLLNDKEAKIESHYFEKGCSPDEAEIKFEQMLKISEKNKLLGNDHKIYGKIKILKNLRNKVHIHLAKNNLETDYNSFDERIFELAKGSLLAILEKYLNLSENEKNNYFKYLL